MNEESINLQWTHTHIHRGIAEARAVAEQVGPLIEDEGLADLVTAGSNLLQAAVQSLQELKETNLDSPLLEPIDALAGELIHSDDAYGQQIGAAFARSTRQWRQYARVLQERNVTQTDFIAGHLINQFEARSEALEQIDEISTLIRGLIDEGNLDETLVNILLDTVLPGLKRLKDLLNQTTHTPVERQAAVSEAKSRVGMINSVIRAAPATVITAAHIDEAWEGIYKLINSIPDVIRL